MAQPVIQTSFHAGEWAPALNARVDLAKYHAAAALVRNWFVDYRGGISTCPGSKYILQGYKSSKAIRLIRFQATSTLSYVLEFGDLYIRFISSGAYVLETAKTITAITKANPAQVTSNAHGFSNGDWVFITGVLGMTQLNGRYFIVAGSATNTFTLTDLNGVAINSTAYTTYSSAGTVARVYTLSSPYAAADLALIKFAQNVNTMILCHPSYNAYVLTLIAASNWNLAAISYGSTIPSPAIASVTITGGVGSSNYGYVATSVDVYGQESPPSAVFTKTGGDTRQAPAASSVAIVLTAAISGALFYNFYKTYQSAGGTVPSGASYGFIGYASSTTFIDANIGPDFAQTPPIAQNPFLGGSVKSVSLSNQGIYTAVPTVSIAAPSSGTQATASCSLEAATLGVSNGGSGYISQETCFMGNGITVIAQSVIAGVVQTVSIANRGSITSGSAPTNVGQNSSSGTGTGLNLSATWRVASVTIINGGLGYSAAPAVTFTAGAPTAVGTAVLDVANVGNPSVPVFYQQRLVLAAPSAAPQSFYMSKPAAPYNFDISKPIQADDAITGVIVSGVLNTIKSLVPMSNGLIMFGSSSAWLVNGGTPGSAITPINATAQSQAYNGASDLPPIVVNYDILFVQAKGSIVRDLTFNYYLSNYTGTDITVLSSHLFYGHFLTEWAYAEEPFKLVWAVRNDGILLSLTFIKEQEIVGWAHRDTSTNLAGVQTQSSFKSVCSVTEAVTLSNGVVINVDAVYVVVQRTINGNVVQYIERFAERIFPNGATDAWCVDAGIQYSGAPATSFTGAEHLAGQTVTGLADGVAITPFVMPTNGFFTLAAPASKVTVGLAFTPQLQTLRLDVGEPTVQGKRKKITGVTVRVQDTLGLSIGKSFSSLVVMKDLVIGNVGSASNSVVSDLVTDDARTVIDPSWSVDGQYCIQQSNPLPATILGVIPEIEIGDTPK